MDTEAYYTSAAVIEKGVTPAGLQLVTTTTETRATDVASATGTTTSGAIATTTETTLTPSPTAYSCVNNEKTPFPAGVLCDTKGYSADPNRIYLTTVTDDATLAHCRDVCRSMNDCVAFAVQPDVFCDLWGGRIQETDGSDTDFSWYSLDCFCDLPELSTTSATATATTDTASLATDTATTELETSSTAPTTSSAELTLSTETTTAAATTTTAAESAPSCPGGFPSDSSCGVSKQYTATGPYIRDIDGTYTLDECLQFCIDDPTCNLFAHAATWCELWNGDYATTGSSVDFSWYELHCFCVEKAPEP